MQEKENKDAEEVKISETNFDESFAGEASENLTKESESAEIAPTTSTVGKRNNKKENQEGPVHYNRSQRRPVQRMIQNSQTRKSTNIQLKDWMQRVRDNQTQGKQLEKRFEQIVRKSLEYQMVTKEANIRAGLKSAGKSKKEIDAHIEDWYDTSKVWKEEV